MRKLELARAMAAEPKLLIADEAMAGLSHSEVDDIVALLIRLNERGVTVILIEHIMRAVMNFSQRLAVLVAGRKIADGKPEEVSATPKSRGRILANSLSVEGIHAGLRRGPCARGRVADRRGRRDRGAARHQRQRQEHPDEDASWAWCGRAPAGSWSRSTASRTT